MFRPLLLAILWPFLASSTFANQTNFATVFVFGGTEAKPNTGIIQASDGLLYGLTFKGGTNGFGVLYSMAADGSRYQVLYSFLEAWFTPNFTDYSTIQEGIDGVLYISSHRLGLLKINKDGSEYARLVSHPVNPGIFDTTDNWIFGIDAGGLFKVRKDGTQFQNLEEVVPLADQLNGVSQSSDSKLYSSRFIEASDGWFYSASIDATNTRGAVYRMRLDGSELTNLHSFSGSGRHYTSSETNEFTDDGAIPRGRLLEASDGFLYGTTQFGGDFSGGTIYRISKNGGTYEILHNFSSSPHDGGQPLAGVIEGLDGRLYGTSSFGGETGQGVVFTLNKDGSDFRILKKFSFRGAIGAVPLGDLIQATDRRLYGTTSRGGSNAYGTVFRLNEDGSGHTILKSFAYSKADGGVPLAGVIEGPDGALYGTTSLGGSNHLGTIFKVNKDGTHYKVLHHFAGGNDGARPAKKLTKASDDFLYGVTRVGGDGNGVVFRISSSGFYQIIYVLNPRQSLNFTSELIEGPDGYLYGAEPGGGHNIDTIFRLSKSGVDFTNLVIFPFGENQYNVYYPWEGLNIGTNGHLYGAAQGIYKFNPVTSETVSFPSYHMESASLGNDGTIYGISHHWWNQATLIVKGDQVGSNYTVLYTNLWTNLALSQFSKLLIAKDASLFTTSVYTGPEAGGSIFKYYAGPFPPLQMLPANYSAAGTILTFTGTPGQTFRLQATDNLENPIWHQVATATISESGTAQITDPQSSAYTNRFYRAAQP